MAYSFKTYRPFYRRNLKVAFPVMLTQLGAALVGLFDSIMVGHYSTTDLAAVSFSNAIFFTVMVFAMGALMGITPLVGHAHGHRDAQLQNGLSADEDDRTIASLLQNGLVFTVLLCLFAVGLLAPCIPLLGHFGQEPVVAVCARPYFTMIVLSIVPFLFFSLFKQVLEGLNNTMVAMLITTGCNLLNILLNWVFIFGHWGAPAMGATGAGLATLISRSLMPVCFVAVVGLQKEWRHYIRLMSGRLNNRHVIRRLAQLGAPIGMQSFVECFLFTASFIIVGWLGKESLAAHQISNQIADMTFMLALGIGAATTMRVSHQLGKGDLWAVHMASKASIHLCLLMNTIGACLMISLRGYIPHLFTNDPEVISIASQLILFAGLLQYADGMQCVGAAMLRGIQDVRVPMRIAVLGYIVVGLPLGMLLMFPVGLGAKGMWMAFVVALAIPAVLFHIRFHRQMRRMEQNGGLIAENN